MTVEKKIVREFERHIQFRESFKDRESAFCKQYVRNGQSYTYSGYSMAIVSDMKKRANKIKKLCLTNG